MQTKKELRCYYSSIREEAKDVSKDKVITERLLMNERILSAQNVLLYASFGSEIDTWELSSRLIKLGKIVAFPKCGKNGHMTFHCVDDIDSLRNNSGMYGICEPDGVLPSPDLSINTVCIVPGLAFTIRGERLGYGGGYYDRFLSSDPSILRLAVAYEVMITECLPVYEHDISIDQIVTEERTVLCNE